MTKDEAILLAVANARGLCRLTEREAKDLNRALLNEAEQIRSDIAAASLRSAQDAVSGFDPNCSMLASLERYVARLQGEAAHMQDVQEAMRSDRAAYRSRSFAIPEPPTASPPVSPSEN